MRTFSRITTIGALAVISSFMAVPASFANSDCQMTLSQPEVNLQVLRQDEAVKTGQGWSVMQEKDINVNVFCTTPRKMAVFFHGNAGDKGYFRFGSQSGLSGKVSQLTVDGQHYPMAKTVNPGSFLPDGSAAEELLVRNREGIIAINGNSPVQGQQMNFRLTLTPVLKESEFKVSDSTTLTSDISLIMIDDQ
ncbi:hypothetical protein LVQ78_14285 [Buttiauxella sp. A2-C2_NF]|uniref:hypothetical protein n=1 Tax=Buttiauxella ferragutiae TaxID=82989 RepID=UPI001E368BC7|nr:hypothetical protein [Buttiauxella ferragutiae]MCE0827192.1 hypothetical protein [Buttiauxella ferragutiae]